MELVTHPSLPHRNNRTQMDKGFFMSLKWQKLHYSGSRNTPGFQLWSTSCHAEIIFFWEQLFSRIVPFLYCASDSDPNYLAIILPPVILLSRGTFFYF